MARARRGVNPRLPARLGPFANARRSATRSAAILAAIQMALGPTSCRAPNVIDKTVIRTAIRKPVQILSPCALQEVRAERHLKKTVFRAASRSRLSPLFFRSDVRTAQTLSPHAPLVRRMLFSGPSSGKSNGIADPRAESRKNAAGAAGGLKHERRDMTKVLYATAAQDGCKSPSCAAKGISKRGQGRRDNHISTAVHCSARLPFAPATFSERRWPFSVPRRK